MGRRLGNILATGLGLLLLVYTASRSLDFIMLTLPPERQILAWFGLAALDGGMIAWLLAYLHGSKSSWQRAISLLMVGLDFVGCVAMFTLDTVYTVGKSGLTSTVSPDVIWGAVIGLSLIIAANIAATVAFHLLDPDALLKHAEEEAQSKIEEEALRLISANSHELAAQLAPGIAETWRLQTSARYQHRISPPIANVIDAIVHDVPEPSAQQEPMDRSPLA